MRQLLALDFGGTFVKCSLIDKEGVIRERTELPAPLKSTETFVQMIESLFEKYVDNVDGIAISIAGIVDSASKTLITAGAYTQILGGKSLCNLLGHLDTRISVENDAKAAALGENWKGKLRGVNNGVALIIGSGLGTGIIIDGKLYKGAHFSSGEVGVIPTEIGAYNPTTTMAQKAGMTAFLKNVALAKGLRLEQFEIAGIKDNARLNTNLPIYSGRDVFQWLEEGDETTWQVYRDWLAALVHIIFSLKLILDPEKIVIGGGVSRNPRLLNDLKQEYEKTRGMTKANDVLKVELDVCQHTADANMLGAVYHWIQCFEN